MSSNAVDTTVNHLFRQESGKMVSVLVKIFGSEHLELAEDVVQDALVSALETWKFRGIPEYPRAWLYSTAKNKAIDIIRRRNKSLLFDFSSPERALLASEYTLATTMDGFWEERSIQDDFLGMIYACCHPEIAPENQVTFALKYLCGFSTREIARAFLTSEDTISKRLYRTKEFFRNSNLRPEIPSDQELSARTASVLSTIYLMFNEGYNSTHADALIREDVIAQALLLCKSLTNNPKTQLPEIFALMALMCFHAARTTSRLSTEGELILLNAQDRSLWNIELIGLGNIYLNKSAFGNSISTYHLEAAIAYEHCAAISYANTNWKSILEKYDALIAMTPDNEILKLNRCIALMEANGSDVAYLEISVLEKNKRLLAYHLYHAVLGTLYERKGDIAAAIGCFSRALTLTQSEHEKRFLTGKITDLKAGKNSPPSP